MKRILVPTDFSVEANNAFEVALQIARSTGADVKLLHVIEMTTSAGFNTMGAVVPSDNIEQVYIMKLMETTRNRMAHLKSLASASGVHVIDQVDVDTNIFSKIKNIINNEQIDLVVMGSKGSSGLDEILVGSNTERVVRLANCPVLTVKNRHENFQVRNIVFASNFNDEASRILNYVVEFQNLFGAQLHLLYVNTPGGFESTARIREKMEDFARRYNLVNYTINVYNDAVEEDGILNFTADMNMDLIVMATHGRTGFSHLLSGSIAEDLVNHTVKPVLTFRLGK